MTVRFTAGNRREGQNGIVAEDIHAQITKPTSPEEVPGGEKGLAEKARGAAEGLLQSFAPLKAIHQHVCGFHMYAHDGRRQVEAHHFCSHVNEDFRQCIIYDGDKSNSRLIGIEYIISRRLFEDLPAEEKRFWHSHSHEVMSGQLIAPGVPEAAERQEMSTLVDTYGKTIHTWQFDKYSLPIGEPQLMTSFLAEGQADAGMVAKRDKAYGIDSKAIADRRKSSITPPETVAEGCDKWFWEKKTPQFKAEEVDAVMPS